MSLVVKKREEEMPANIRLDIPLKERWDPIEIAMAATSIITVAFYLTSNGSFGCGRR